jgi:hypothetical protein
MVLAASVPVNSYVGSGSASSFAFNFPIFAATDLLVTVLNTVTGVTDTLVLGTDYSCSTIQSGIANTGTITLINASQAWLSGGNLATNWTLSIVINNPLAQTFSFRNQGDFYRSSIENALDYQMMCIQQLQVAGYVLVDIITGTMYRLIMVNGVLSQIQIS